MSPPNLGALTSKKKKKNIEGLKPGYETTLVTRNEMSESAHKSLMGKLEAIIKKFKGEVVYTEDWGNRRLAYAVQKETRGKYTYFVYTAESGVVSELERNLRIQDPVLRFLTVKLDDHFDKVEDLQKPSIFMKAKAERSDRPDRPERGFSDRGDRGDRWGDRDRGDRYER